MILARQKSILKYSDNSVEENADNNLLDDNLLDDDLLGDNSSAYINSDINMNTEAKLNPNKDITGNNCKRG